MIHLTLLAATVPHTPTWSPTIAIVMVICNLLAFAIGRLTIQKPNEGPGDIAGLSFPALLGVASFGHVVGAGAILGLANLGVL